MVRDFLISVASGLVVAVLAGLIFGRHRDRRPGPTQSMSMTRNSGSGFGRILLAFLLGAALIFVVLFFARGYDGRRGGFDRGYDRAPYYSDRFR